MPCSFLLHINYDSMTWCSSPFSIYLRHLPSVQDNAQGGRHNCRPSQAAIPLHHQSHPLPKTEGLDAWFYQGPPVTWLGTLCKIRNLQSWHTRPGLSSGRTPIYPSVPAFTQIPPSVPSGPEDGRTGRLGTLIRAAFRRTLFPARPTHSYAVLTPPPGNHYQHLQRKSGKGD